jgi:DNA-binding LytR/AlgR family response regulator
MKYNCVIVDDEPMAGNFIQHYCEKMKVFDVLGVFESAREALELLKKQKIDLLFLDVEMPEISGFQLLDQLSYMPKVVLTTSKTEHAFNAFQYNVSDYLKKPIAFTRFQDSCNKIIESLQKPDTNPVIPMELNKIQDDIFIKSDGKIVRLTYDDILYIESMGDYVKYFTTIRSYVTHSTLKAVEERVARKNFMKVHRSYIVNLKKIKDIQDNSLVIEGKVIPISKTFKSDVLQKIGVG